MRLLMVSVEGYRIDHWGPMAWGEKLPDVMDLSVPEVGGQMLADIEAQLQAPPPDVWPPRPVVRVAEYMASVDLLPDTWFCWFWNHVNDGPHEFHHGANRVSLVKVKVFVLEVMEVWHRLASRPQGGEDLPGFPTEDELNAWANEMEGWADFYVDVED